MNAVTAYALVWIFVSICILGCVIATGSLMPLWAFIFPASVSMKD